MGHLWGKLRAAFRADTIAPEALSQDPSKALLSALGGFVSAAGVHVTRAAILNIPEVEACHRVIAQGVARCPLKVRVANSGGWVDAYESPFWELLHDLPNPEQTASAFRTQMTRDLLAHERAFAQIVRRSYDGTVVSLWRLDPARMTVDRDALNRKRYTYRLADGSSQTWTFDADRPPVLDLEYPSPVGRCRELFGLALALEQYAGLFFSNGARLSGLLSTDAPKLTDDQVKQLRDQFRAMNTGLHNSHGVAVATGGMKFTPITAENAKAQLLELRKFVREQICGVYGVPPYKIADLERATFSNIEHADRDFLASTLDPLYVLWEQSIRRDLLTTRQYPRYRATFDREALISTDMKSRLDAMAVGRQNGIYSANDVRRKLEENPIPAAEGGDLYHMNGNMVPLTGAPQPKGASPSADAAGTPASDSPERVM